MKLRCVTNSIRIRVKKSDLATLTATQTIRDEVKFGGQVALSYGVTIDPQAAQLRATFENQSITIVLPQEVAANWMDTPQVGIEAYLPLDQADEQLHILIEKDFPCQHRDDEDKSDTFTELAKQA